jgi:hypothetical protein
VLLILWSLNLTFEADFTDEDFGASISVSGMAPGYVASPGAYIGAHDDVGQVQIYEIGPGKLERRSLVSTERLFGSAVAFRRRNDCCCWSINRIAGYVKSFVRTEQFGTKSDKLSKDGS